MNWLRHAARTPGCAKSAGLSGILRGRLHRPDGQRFRRPTKKRPAATTRTTLTVLCRELIGYLEEDQPLSVDNIRRAVFPLPWAAMARRNPGGRLPGARGRADGGHRLTTPDAGAHLPGHARRRIAGSPTPGIADAGSPLLSHRSVPQRPFRGVKPGHEARQGSAARGPAWPGTPRIVTANAAGTVQAAGCASHDEHGRWSAQHRARRPPSRCRRAPRRSSCRRLPRRRSVPATRCPAAAPGRWWTP